MNEPNQENVESFHMLIGNYEALVRDLNQEVYNLKHEQDNLRSQISHVIEENNQLSNDLQNALSCGQSNVYTSDKHYNNILDNYKDQINVLRTEKEYVTKLWQEGIKTIDHLEDELKVLRAGTESFVPKKEFQKLKHFYQEKLNDLQIKLVTSQRQLDDAIKRSKTDIEVKHCEIDQSLENQASALKIVKNLEAEVLKLQKRLQEAVGEKTHLEKCLQHKEDLIQGVKKANVDCLNRVAEAVCIVEAALNEKDAALFREKETKEENEKLVQAMTEMVTETQLKIKNETLRITADHNEKQKSLLEELGRVQNEIKNKSSEVEGLNKKCHLLENEIERMHKGHCNIDESDINKLLILEKNLESTFQKLLISEKQNIQLTSEKEVIKNDMDQMAGMYERNLKAKEIEISTHKSKINRLEIELNGSYEQVNKLSERMMKLNEQIARTEQEFVSQKENYERGLKSQYDRKVQSLNDTYKSNVEELQLQIVKKNEINQKWRHETKTITENLEKLISNLKRDLQRLKKENKVLRETVRKSDEKVKQYKQFLGLISKDVNKISHLTVGNEVS